MVMTLGNFRDGDREFLEPFLHGKGDYEPSYTERMGSDQPAHDGQSPRDRLYNAKRQALPDVQTQANTVLKKLRRREQEAQEQRIVTAFSAGGVILFTIGTSGFLMNNGFDTQPNVPAITMTLITAGIIGGMAGFLTGRASVRQNSRK